jgi:hypothetical protein
MAIDKERPMTIQELEQHLLGLGKSEQQHLADLLNRSLAEQLVPSSPANSFDIQKILTNSSDEAWQQAIQKLEQPIEPSGLAELLQSWEDEGDEQEQRETWELLQTAFDKGRHISL